MTSHRTPGKRTHLAGGWLLAMAAILGPGLDAATLRGRVTECDSTAGAAGFVVEGFEEMRLRFPCPSGTATKQIGTVTCAADGTYTIDYTPTERIGACTNLTDRKVFITVKHPDGTTVVGTSPTETATGFNNIDFATGTSNNCPEPRFILSFIGPSLVTGQAGTTASFEAMVLLDTEFAGRQGLHGAESWIVNVAAEGGTVIAATTEGTLGAEFNDDPSGLVCLSVLGLDTTTQGPQCRNLHVAQSGGFITPPPTSSCPPVSELGLPLAGAPALILRVAVQVQIPASGVDGACRVFFPENCAVVGLPVGNEGFYRGGVGFAPTEKRELLVTLRADQVSSPFRRADANGDGEVDVSDAVNTFGYLFLGGRGPDCLDAADCNADGSIDISDGVNTLGYLFGGSRGIPAPGPQRCGEGSEPAMGCASYPGCD